MSRRPELHETIYRSRDRIRARSTDAIGPALNATVLLDELVAAQIVADLKALEALEAREAGADAPREVPPAAIPPRAAPFPPHAHRAPRRRAVRRGVLASMLAALVLLSALACGGDADPAVAGPDVEPVATVAVTPERDTLVVGTTLPLAATPRNAAGRPLDGRAVGWTSSDPSVAIVSPAGRVTAVAHGVATIAAASEGRTGRAEIVVTRPPVTRLVVEPAAAALAPGETRTFAATAYDATGAVVPDATFAWVSADPSVATVDPAGRVTARQPGITVVTASVDGARATVGLTVLLPPPDPGPAPVARLDVTPTGLLLDRGATRQLQAIVRDAAGNVLTGRTVTWATDNAPVATVSATGLVTATGPGYATIIARSEGKTFGVAVTVTAATLRDFQLTRAGGAALPQTLYTTTERDAAGVVRTVRWDAHAGYIRLRDDGGYEQAIQYWIVRENGPATQGTMVYHGTYRDDGIVPGQLVFTPFGGRAPFVGRILPDVTLSLTQQVEPTAPAQAFVYSMP